MISLLGLTACEGALPSEGARVTSLAFIESPGDLRGEASIARAPRRPTPRLGQERGARTYFARMTVDARADGRELALVPDRGWRRVTAVERGRVSETGSRVPLRARPIARGSPVLVVDTRDTHEVLLRFEGDLDGWEPPQRFLERVEPLAQAEARDRLEKLTLGAYAGVLLALTLVNLLFGRILRDRIYVDYVLYAIPYATIWLARDFLFAELFWPDTPYVDDAILFVVICASIVLGNRFAMRFLETKETLPVTHRALIAVNLLVGVVVVLALVGTFRPVPPMLGLAALATSVTYIASGIVASVRGRGRQGGYFTAATGTLAIGTIIYTLTDFAVLPWTQLTDHSAQIGSAIEMALLALALADRVRQGQAELRRAEVLHRTSLEREVSDRTAELEQLNDRLIELNQQLQALSLTDALTGIANRRRFESALHDEWRRAIRDEVPISLLIVDVDHFKPFNDRYGHPAGDECLRRVARVLAAGSRRAGDLLARYGGEEFVLILPNTGEEAALAHAERLRSAVAETPMNDEPNDKAAHVTVSIGVACALLGAHETDPRASLLAPADAALYRAKSAGRDRVEASVIRSVSRPPSEAPRAP